MNAGKPVLLLDLGGVLADLGDPVGAMGLSMTLAEFWATWTSSATVRRFETGRMGGEEFLSEIPAELGYAGARGFAQQFHAWQLQLYPGVSDLVREAMRHCRVALLSNTNAIHWRQVTASHGLFEEFERVFLSFETGHFKPSPAAFDQVMEYFDCSPGEVVFLDDSDVNIAAARELGIDARRVAGVAELAQQLLGVADRT